MTRRSYLARESLSQFNSIRRLACGSGHWGSPVLATPLAGREGGQLSFAAENGTAYIVTALTQSLQFSPTDESLFGLVSVDLAEYSTVLSDPVTVPFIGYRQDGSTVRISFTTDGIIDGSGPIEDFETLTFDSSWVGLTRVEISTWGWSLDNLVVSIPEPSSGVLLMIGAGVSSIWRRGCWRCNKSTGVIDL